MAGEPHRFGKYALLERIGVGGMAEVFKAKIFGAEGFERLVAIKRILPQLVEDEDFVKMFIDEAKIAVRLNHPNIVGIQDLGKAEGTLFIAMEYVPGRDLRALYEFEKERGGRTPLGIGCHIVMKMCEALHHAHFATGPRGEPLQVIHRDVSPQNVIVSFDGEVKVADFGLAKARGRMVQTQAGVVKGKLAYMSPEQLRGDEIDHRVDVFGLGIVLFELLAGERLFLGPSDMDTLRRVYECRVPPLAPLNPEVGPELEAIVRRALAKDRDERYQTALELHDDLQAYVYGHDVYRGASALRRYMREAFPEAAPPPEAELPPFAEPAPPPPQPPPVPAEARPSAAPPAPPSQAPAPPRSTHRPPALRRSDEIPPPSMPPAAGTDDDEILSPPPLEESGLLFDDSTAHEAVMELDGSEVDELPTDRPPPPDEAVVARPIRSTGHPPPPESSGVASSGSLPHVPDGIYEEELSTEQVHADVAYEPGPDTNPAPAPVGGVDLPDWSEDEATILTPRQTSEADTDDEERTADDPWGDEATVVVDPRSTGSGSS